MLQRNHFNQNKKNGEISNIIKPNIQKHSWFFDEANKFAAQNFLNANENLVPSNVRKTCKHVLCINGDIW